MLFPVCLSHEFRFLRLACLLLCFGVAFGFWLCLSPSPPFPAIVGVGPVQFGMCFFRCVCRTSFRFSVLPVFCFALVSLLALALPFGLVPPVTVGVRQGRPCSFWYGFQVCLACCNLLLLVCVVVACSRKGVVVCVRFIRRHANAFRGRTEDEI